MDDLRRVLTRLEEKRVALGHFNVADLTLLKAVIAAAAEIEVPALAGASEGERDFFGTRRLAPLVKSFREECVVPIFQNADHTHSLTKAGFDAVVIDFSSLPFEEKCVSDEKNRGSN